MVPAAAVIPGLQVFLLCVAVKTLVVDIGFCIFLYEKLVFHRLNAKSFVLMQINTFYLEEIRVFKAGLMPLDIIARNNETRLQWFLV